jgi:hypothetical protein
MSGNDRKVSYIEVVAAFKAITDILLEYVYGWACTKSGKVLPIPGFAEGSEHTNA